MTSDNVEIAFIGKNELFTIITFIQILNPDIKRNVLEDRTVEMFDQNYSCLGIYFENKLIGICGLWFMTRHYSGRCIEPDHVIINDEFRGKGIGKILFDWIFKYAKENNYESTELNTYVRNTASHKFYYNLGYEIMGYHFVK